jgi:hypothetical protein
MAPRRDSGPPRILRRRGAATITRENRYVELSELGLSVVSSASRPTPEESRCRRPDTDYRPLYLHRRLKDRFLHHVADTPLSNELHVEELLHVIVRPVRGGRPLALVLVKPDRAAPVFVPVRAACGPA